MESKEFLDLINTGKIKNYTIVDVRTEEEYLEAHIPGSILKDVRNIFSIDDLEEFDKSKPVIVYCHSGGRSFMASITFKEAGFNVQNLEGGVLELSKKGYKGFITN